jgi:hypothetical protein
MSLFEDFRRSRRRNKAWKEAHHFKRAGNFAAAAEVYERLSTDSLHYELIYEDGCHDAFKLWLKASNVEKALIQARNALRVISDSDWISKSSDTVDDLCKIVGELYAAGYLSAADTFSREINEELIAHGLPARFDIKRGQFPTSCPQCGGSLPSTFNEESLTCPYCGSVIHGQ